jgi:hypothetical protein
MNGRMRTMAMWIALASGSVSSTACEGIGAVGQDVDSVAVTAASRAAVAPAAATAFELVVTSPPPGPAKHETAGQIRVVAKGEFHINVEYLWKFSSKRSDNVRLNKEILGPEDAIDSNERELAFEVRATAAGPGRHWVGGILTLSLCDDTGCQIESIPVGFDLPTTD